MSVVSAALLGGVRAAFASPARRFRAALADPERAQRERLAAVLRAVAGTEQARRFGLAKVRTARELQDAVPVRGYDELAEDVRAAYEGKARVLTAGPVVRFELSGGSSGASKLVPMTEGLSGEFHRALAPWLFDLLDRRPALRRGPGYWSISPLGQRRERSPGGVPVGSIEDAAYFPRPLQPLLRRALAVPGEVARVPDVQSCRQVTLWHLVACADLRMISVWNPSFLTLLLSALDEGADRLAADLEAGRCAGALPGMRFPRRPDRATALREAVGGSGRVDVRRLWPQLSLVSLWTDAEAARALSPLRERLPGIELQGKGLLATEGVVTLPLFDAPAPVLAVRSHFYELIPVAPTGPG
ncbi:MAG TPA: GH3 auxin-responsive promoter family protein, partial [Myxococcales bacterium]|nr:GH3 auxin-responsive promoter family protein [Myxococcales bacterium]